MPTKIQLGTSREPARHVSSSCLHAVAFNQLTCCRCRLCCSQHAGPMLAAQSRTGARPTRTLLQQPKCPPGCKEGKCVPASIPGGLACAECQDTMFVNPDKGTCRCPAGTYFKAGTGGSSGTKYCTDCEKG